MIELALTAAVLIALAVAFDSSDSKSSKSAMVTSEQIRAQSRAMAQNAHKFKRGRA